MVDDDVRRRLGTALEAYGKARNTAGRVDLFMLFTGTGDDEVPHIG
ncbi:MULTISPECIES: hypothetical protein [unclassified Streptomyces]|nr:hypothetical protein [Streptomyces sp. NBC_01264]MCX4783884.1 hypothetical protein [Streptomyces sp. NBC_01264]